MTLKVIKCLKTIFYHSDQVLMRQAGRKFECTHLHIIKTLAKYTGIKIYTKHGMPDQQEGQKEQIKTGIDCLYHNFQGKLVILANKFYFTLSHSTINGIGTYYSNDRDKTLPSFKYCKKVDNLPAVLDAAQSKTYEVF